MFKRTLLIAAIALTVSACQPSSPNINYDGDSSSRQAECNKILTQLGVSGDDILNPGVATTPDRKRLVSLYSAYGCDK
jgi:hypothetical protein